MHRKVPELKLAGQTQRLLFLRTSFLFRNDSASTLLGTQPRFSTVDGTSPITVPTSLIKLALRTSSARHYAKIIQWTLSLSYQLHRLLLKMKTQVK